MGSHILTVLVMLSTHLLSTFVNPAAIPAGTVIMDEKPVLLRGRQGDLQCRFRESPVAIYWLKGDTYGSSSNLITWHNGDISYHGHKGAYFIDEDYSLIINNVTDEDAGTYYCRVSTIDGIVLYNSAEVTVKVPPPEYPTIDECRNSSTQTCSLDVKHDETTNLTCRTEGATIGLVSLGWTHGCRHRLSEPRQVSSPNQDGETEDIASIITVQDCQGEFRCVATVNATRVEPEPVSIYVYFTMEETSTMSKSTSKGITDISPEKETNVGMPVVIVLVVLFSVVVLIAGIRRYIRKIKHGSSGRSDIEMPMRGLILYWDLWMLVNLKPEDKNYLQNLNEVVERLTKEKCKNNEDLNINSLYQELCEWKKQCEENAQEKRLEEAMDKSGLREEFQKIKGLLLYWDLWMLANLKPNDETYLQKMNEMVANLTKKTDEDNGDLNIISIYNKLSEWKKSCEENAQEKRLGEAMVNNGLREEYLQIKELRKNTDADLTNDLSHICWLLRDIGWTVSVRGDYLSFHHLAKQSEQHEIKAIDSDYSLVAKDIETFNTWRDEFLRRHCCQPVNRLEGENETLLNQNVTNPLMFNLNMEICRVLEEAGLNQIAHKMFLIPEKYKRLSDDDMKIFAEHITIRHCNIIGEKADLKPNIIVEKNSENVTALFDTAAMLKECSRRYGNYALRCKLRKIAEKLDRSEEFKDDCIDHASSVIYQPSGITEIIITNEQPGTSSGSDSKTTQESEVMQAGDVQPHQTESDKHVYPKSKEYIPPAITNEYVYYAEVVPVAYCILLEDVIPFAEGLGIDRNQLDQFRPPRNHLYEGTSYLVMDVLLKCKNEKPEKTRSRFADVLRTTGFVDAAELITHDYELSLTELKPILTKLVSSKIVCLDDLETFFDVSAEAIDGWQNGDVWQVMKKWKTKLRSDPYPYRLELENALKEVRLDDKTIDGLLGQGETKNLSRPSDDILKNLIIDAGIDEVWNVIKEWRSSGQNSTPSSIDEKAPLVHEMVAEMNEVLGHRVSSHEIEKRINMLFLSGFFDMTYEYAVLRRV